ncbi:precorrin-3B C17-methyltransferase [Anaerosolibacter carboniphilus]|uniref:Precorrin-3B C17-methyltransferase n=1 Tax=Anaerosolibacter carboniphilus TaxID=1417629 RepID=A0A841KMG3_9FIRM|nr:precorrin-3B C(17)-methyltransferase [Anaerosolibacter carboniphilus]MBB6214593.1 precorrin-3B C17-methyltransferase [Anaerosolibacter carboniphilus]
MKSQNKIYVVGIGPGNREHMSVRAIEAIAEADVIIGYKTYIDLIKDLIVDKEVIDSGMRKEVERCNLTLDYALQGKNVAIISSGDAGVYGMAGIMLEVKYERNSDVEIEVVPGITAASAASAVLGAPMMHDFAVISLSDLLTEWELIKKRLDCAAMGDFIVALYNPKSMGRVHQIEEAREIMMKYKAGSTPVGIVKNAKRQGEQAVITDLEHMLEHDIDMLTVVVIGNAHTYVKDGKMITPRGYQI